MMEPIVSASEKSLALQFQKQFCRNKKGGTIMGFRSKIGRRETAFGTVILLVIGFCLLFLSSANAALYIKFDGIDGEATQKDHENWSVISDVEWGVSYTAGVGSGGGGGAGRAVLDDLYWSQVMDRSYPKLFDAIVKGRHIHDVSVDFATPIGDGGEFTYFKMTFTEALLTQLNLSGQSNQKATFCGNFSYGRINMIYFEMKPDGSQGKYTEAEYDISGSGKDSIGMLGLVYSMGLGGPTYGSTPVPEPLVLWLLGFGFACLMGLRHKIFLS
jgi:type VI secretion system secreted protein Hcp